MTFDVLAFTIPGEPQGKGRPRFVRYKNGSSGTYTPQNTVSYENLVKSIAHKTLGSHTPCELPIEISVTAYCGIPKSFSKSKRQMAINGFLRPTKKPDIDNILKIIADSLNTVAWRDDAQLVAATVRKFYSETPRVEAFIRAQGSIPGGKYEL